MLTYSLLLYGGMSVEQIIVWVVSETLHLQVPVDPLVHFCTNRGKFVRVDMQCQWRSQELTVGAQGI